MLINFSTHRSRIEKIDLKYDFAIREFTSKVMDPGLKNTVHMTPYFLEQAARLTHGKVLGRIHHERLWIDVRAFGFPRHHFLIEPFDHKIQQLFEAGLISKFREMIGYGGYLNPKHPEYLRYKELYEPDGPQVLTMEHLEACFVIWLVSIVIAVVAFALEWICYLIERTLKNSFTA